MKMGFNFILISPALVGLLLSTATAAVREAEPAHGSDAQRVGAPGPPMPAFDSLPPADRWSLAFFVMRLGHEGEATRGPVAMSLADMAEETDAELKEDLRSAGHPDPAAGVAWVRCYAAFAVLPTGVEIDRVRGLASRAVRARLEGGRAGGGR